MEKALSGVDHKAITIQLKADSPGDFEAIFSTLNVIDHDQDVTIPGAFHSQDVKISAYGHASWATASELPVGRGTISEDDQTMTAKVVGRFFLNTTGGRDTYETVKALDDLQEWSYGFKIVDAEMGQFQGQTVRIIKSVDVFEVSPVMRGAGIATRTTAIKGAGLSLADHSVEVLADVDAWIARINAVAKLRSDDAKTALNDVNVGRLLSLKSFLNDAQSALADLLDNAHQTDGGLDVTVLYSQFQRLRTQLQGVF